MTDFRKIVNGVIKQADVLILLLDARLVEETRNPEIEKKVKFLGKPLIYVITKSDLIASKKYVEKFKRTLNPCVFVSSKTYHGLKILREKIMAEGKRLDKEVIKVGILGYPNVGKSSFINAMSGRRAAPTSMMSGYTRSMRKIKDRKIMFLDTPGLIPYKEKSQIKHAIIGAIDFTKSKNPDLVIIQITEQFPGRIEKYYGVDVNADFEQTIRAIAVKKKVLMKGNIPDSERMYRLILKEWQNGKIV